MKKVSVITVLLILIVYIICVFNQSVSEGYVYSSRDDSKVWVIELSKTEIHGKTKEQILDLIETKATESRGIFYDVPLINKALNTSFEKGQKVKIYWTGVVMQSAPGKIKDTFLIMKIK
jgi:hypothetical protein